MAWFVYLVMWLLSGGPITATNVPKPLSLTSSLLGNSATTADMEDDGEDDDDDDEDDDDEDDEAPGPQGASGTGASNPKPATTVASSVLTPPALQKSLIGSSTGPNASQTQSPGNKLTLAPPPPLAMPNGGVAISKKAKIMAAIMNPKYPCIWRCNAFASNYCHRRVMMLNYPPM